MINERGATVVNREAIRRPFDQDQVEEAPSAHLIRTFEQFSHGGAQHQHEILHSITPSSPPNPDMVHIIREATLNKEGGFCLNKSWKPLVSSFKGCRKQPFLVHAPTLPSLGIHQPWLPVCCCCSYPLLHPHYKLTTSIPCFHVCNWHEQPSIELTLVTLLSPTGSLCIQRKPTGTEWLSCMFILFPLLLLSQVATF